MRILLVSDLHYTLKQLDWVVAEAGAYDLVVLAGDSLDIGSIVAPEAQIAVMREVFTRLASKTVTVVASGNHDLDAENDLGERAALWLEGARDTGALVDYSRYETDDFLVSVCPWWDGPRTRDIVGKQLADDAALAGARQWIWVYHAPPDSSTTSWTGRRHYGDDALNAWIDEHQPAIVLCGHVHQSPFANGGGWIDRMGSTLIFNAGRQTGPIPTFVEIDTDAATACWVSWNGVEERALDTIAAGQGG